MNNSISFNRAEKCLAHALKRGASVMLHGSPSSGKTAIGSLVAKKASLEPIVFSLLDHDPCDMSGLPDVSGEKAVFKPFNTFPIEGDPLPKGKNGWLIQLDEFASGTREMQSAANKLLFERMVGNHKLHPKAFVMAMGNLETDNAFVNPMPAHTKSRQVHLYVHQDVEEWIQWGASAGIDSRVLAIAAYRPNYIQEYDPDSVDINYTCARTLEELSDQIKGVKTEDLKEIMPVIRGTIGEGAATEFKSFCAVYKDLVTIKEIIADPENCKLPQRAEQRYATASLLYESMTVDNATELVTYARRLPQEHQMLTLRMAFKNKNNLDENAEFDKWLDDFANLLI